MKYLSLFSGIGGFELGIQQAHVDFINRSEDRKGKANPKANAKKGERLVRAQRQSSRSSERPDDELPDRLHDKGTPHCVGYSEIDKYAIQIYEKHFPEHKNYGDITKIKTEELPDFDLLCGGFPCQAFSIAGKRGGFNDTRGTLFFEIARILRDKQPKLLLLENVKGLLSHDEGRTFATIIATLYELGYDLQWQVLNSKNFGVPQNRERVFIVGHLRGQSRPKVFPIGEDGEFPDSEQQQRVQREIQANRGGGGKSDNHSEVLENGEDRPLHYVGAIMSEQNRKRLEDGKQLSRNFPQGQRVYSADGISTTLASQAGGLGAKTGLYAVKYGQNNPERNGNTSDTMFTLKAGGSNAGISDGMNIRRLTPKECCRLQGFPDEWVDGISDTQKYKTLGNAVSVPVVGCIVKKLFSV